MTISTERFFNSSVFRNRKVFENQLTIYSIRWVKSFLNKIELASFSSHIGDNKIKVYIDMILPICIIQIQANPVVFKNIL